LPIASDYILDTSDITSCIIVASQSVHRHCWGQQRKSFEKVSIYNYILNSKLTDNSLCTRTSVGWVPSEGEGIQKHAKRFLKQAGGVRCKDEAMRLEP
jgi:hypothetical protein